MAKPPKTIVGKILVWIKYISNHVFALLRYGRINVIALFAIYFTLWYTPQGQDILVGMPETYWRVLTSYLLLFAMALLNWYFPRLFYPVNEGLFDSFGAFFKKATSYSMEKLSRKQFIETMARDLIPTEYEPRMLKVDPYKEVSDGLKVRERGIWEPEAPEPGTVAAKHEVLVSRLLPRALGMATFLVIAGGVLVIHLSYYMGMDSSAVSFWMTVGVLGLSYLFSLGLHRMTGWLIKSNRWWYLCLILLISMGILGYFGNNSSIGLPLLAFSLVFAALAFGIFVTIRTKVRSLLFLFDDYGMATFTLIVTALSFTSFIVLNFFPSVRLVFPLNALLLGLIFYIGLVCLLAFWGKSKQTYFLSLFILVAIILATVWTTDLHRVTTVERTVALTERISLESYLDQWFAARREALPDSSTTNKFPLFIVMGEGGGSRAAYWTNLTLGTFHEATDGRFQDHCLAITTVSGSSFGTAAHLAQLYHEKTNGIADTISFNDAVNDALTFQGNYLSTSLVKFIGADFWRTILPPLYYATAKHDRAYHLEWEWTFGVQRAMNRLGADPKTMVFQRPYLAHYYQDDGSIRTDLPLYMPNTTHVSTGNRSLITPVKVFDATDHSTEVFDFVGMEGRDFPLAAAALMSARFPFINPGGLISPDDQFVDGGYYENIGGVTANKLLEKTEAYLLKNGLEDKVEVHLITIFNGDRDKDRLPVTEQTNGDLSPQLFVPVSAFASTPFAGHTDYWPAYFDGQLGDRYHWILLDHDLEVEIDGRVRQVIMPLARYLSQSAGEAIRANAEALEKREEFRRICSLVDGMER